MRMEDLTGTRTLVRLFLRKDRVQLPIWIGLLFLSLVGTLSSYQKLLPNARAIREAAQIVNGNPGVMAMTGPIYAANYGSLTAYKLGTTGLTLVALMSLLLVIRHTRGEEELGRRELLGSTVVGRHAGLTAALVVAFGANLVLGALSAIGLAGMGVPATGSIALGLSWAAIGCLFAVIAGAAAQMTEGAGAAKGIVGTLLGLIFMLRAIGDAGGETGTLSWLSWLSPIGWGQRMRPFANEQWWILWLFIGSIAIFTVIAYTLSSRRDIGAGILLPRLGPATASPGLRSPFALAWRLNWGSLLGWSAGFGLMGLGMGGVTRTITSAVKNDEAMQKMQEIMTKLGGRGGLTDTFATAMLSMFGLIISVYAVQAVLRLRSEEEELHAEQLLGTAVSRLQWVASHLIFAIIGSAVILAVTGLTFGLTYGLSTGEPWHQLTRILAGALVQLPAVWIIAGITMALYGLLPKLGALSWAALTAFLVLGQLGELLKLSQSVMNLSPFTHVPKLPGGEVAAAPLIWMVVIAALLTASGLIGVSRRDIGR